VSSSVRDVATRWTTVVPAVAVVALAFTWGWKGLPAVVVAITAVLLVGAVLAAVHHAEVVAHRVGEPYGSLVLAVAVTVIEVALIVTLMITAAEGNEALARDTVFAAVMITCNGIVGICLVLAALRDPLVVINNEGVGSALAAVAALTTLSLALPTFTTSSPGPTFSTAQLTFAAIASIGVYGLFVFVQTVRHRDFFLPPGGSPAAADPDEHAVAPSDRAAVNSLVLLLVALVAVVGLAKVDSPTIESAVEDAGLPASVVGVVIALLVLAPETAVRAARRGRVQTSMNLALGSAMASIGLTIPVIAVASVWLEGPLVLGLGGTQLVLLALTVAVGTLTLTNGRATVLSGGVHLAVAGAFIVTALSP
jgi:Ca2+:H+ antiporter